MCFALVSFISCFDTHEALSLIPAFYSIVLQLSIVCAAAIFFSSIVVTPMLSGAFTFALYVCGRSSDYLLTFVNNPESSELVKTLAKNCYNLLPHLDQVDVGNQVVYGSIISIDFFVWSSIYCLSYALVLLMIAIIAFQKREFK
jgi:ABC-type transport system involved in multi-copper enzyme maturation permease subunit